MLFDRPWGRPPVENCIASSSSSGFTSGSLPLYGQGQLQQNSRRHHSCIVRIAAPEKEAKGKQSNNGAKGKQSNHGDRKPMIYEKEEVEYGDGAVTKASNDPREIFPPLRADKGCCKQSGFQAHSASGGLPAHAS